MRRNLLIFATVIGLFVGTTFASTAAEGVRFEHNDWELVCDNTRTCRAAGYQSLEKDENRPVSMLLTRAAGPNTPVTAEVQLGGIDEDSPIEKKKARQALYLRINGQVIQGRLESRNGIFLLTNQQVLATLAALKRSSRLELIRGRDIWSLSDKGAAAVLLKMDEIQGRLNTPGALMRQGKRQESSVLPAVPAPMVYAAPLAKPQPEDTMFVQRHSKALQQLLGGKKGEEFCELWSEEAAEFNVTRLSADRLLLMSPCWRAAYNQADAAWIIRDRPPFQPVLVTEAVNDFAEGTLSYSHKGRGIGDCWSHIEWTWDGTGFVKTSEGTSGMCRWIAVGGAWSMPTLVTIVKQRP